MIIRRLLQKFRKFAFYTTMLPFYWLSLVFPRDKNLWVFGAWFGEKYADNSKYLFEYVNKYHPEIKAVWLTSNQSTFDLLKSKGFNVARIYSWEGIKYSLKAKVGIISTGLNDINMYLTGNMHIVQLWHGIPLKKIMFDDKITFKHPTLLKKFLFFIFPFLRKNIDYSKALLIATSEEVQEKISSAFKVSKECVKITGLPRNDALLLPPNKGLTFVRKLIGLKSQGKRLIIYMPTHRKEGTKDIGNLFISNIDYINEQLAKLNCVLLIKFHYYHMDNSIHLFKDKFSNIIFIDDEVIEQDIYNILGLMDILITDYSSVFFDFLLLDRPIIFAPFDIEDYLKEDREFYYDYNEITPGPKARNWSEVLEYIEDAIKFPGKFKDRRKIVRDKFFRFKDTNNSDRVFMEIKKFIS